LTTGFTAAKPVITEKPDDERIADGSIMILASNQLAEYEAEGFTQ